MTKKRQKVTVFNKDSPIFGEIKSITREVEESDKGFNLPNLLPKKKCKVIRIN